MGPCRSAGARTCGQAQRVLRLPANRRPKRPALLLGRRLFGCRGGLAARAPGRLGRASAGLAGGHRGLVAGHRGLGVTLPRLHGFLLNGASANRRRFAGQTCLRVVSFPLRCCGTLTWASRPHATRASRDPRARARPHLERFLEQADPFEPNVSSRSCFFSFTPDNRPPPDVSGTARYDPTRTLVAKPRDARKPPITPARSRPTSGTEWASAATDAVFQRGSARRMARALTTRRMSEQPPRLNLAPDGPALRAWCRRRGSRRGRSPRSPG